MCKVFTFTFLSSATNIVSYLQRSNARLEAQTCEVYYHWYLVTSIHFLLWIKNPKQLLNSFKYFYYSWRRRGGVESGVILSNCILKTPSNLKARAAQNALIIQWNLCLSSGQELLFWRRCNQIIMRCFCHCYLR